MKRKRFFKLVSLIIAIAIILSLPTFAAAPTTSTIVNAAHEYRILPETQEWLSLSHSERVASCFVPAEKLSAMTTQALVETVMNYPYLVNIFAYNTIEDGIESLSSQFLGIEILTARLDAVKELNNYADALKTGTKSSINASAHTAAGFISSYISNKQNPVFGFAGTLNARGSLTQFNTRGGNTVYAYVNLTWPEHGSPNLTEIMSDYGTRYPSATMLRSANPAYNCHSYAWYSQSTSNNLWIDDPTPYLTDYMYVTQTSSPSPNNRVTYGSGISSHSGIISSGSGSNTIVTSKWGFMGLYSHKIYECPYSGNMRYWVVS